MPLQATSGAASYDAFGGGVPVVPNYIEDVFSTYLYTGNSSTQTITNGIDLSGKGGLVWVKNRNSAGEHALFDTVRGVGNWLTTNSTAAQYASTSTTAFLSSGFSLANGDYVGEVNQSTRTYASWTFRKQPKFFDVVTYTGDSNNSRMLSHSLGSVPACIITKCTSTTSNWMTWHIASGITTSVTGFELNGTAAATTTGYDVSTDITSTQFRPAAIFDSASNEPNVSGRTYVAYLFASNAGGFGLTGTDNVITCGTFEGTANTAVTLGYEPQWILVKNITAGSNWSIIDTMRGMAVGSAGPARLNANTTAAESDNNLFSPTATGFVWTANAAENNYIYIAIRRGPMKVPTSGTSVFFPQAYADSSLGSANPTNLGASAGFPADFFMHSIRSGDTFCADIFDRMRGSVPVLSTSSADAESTAGQLNGFNNAFDIMSGVKAKLNDRYYGSVGRDHIGWFLRRAPSFFDEVCYTGTGSARTVTHNLAAVPEMMIVKVRDSATDWAVYHSGIGATKRLILNLTDTPYTSATAGWNDTAPTASVFTVGTNVNVNGNGYLYVAYLFATCVGVSKVFSYTGNGSSQTINCGFTGGARWVMIKRTDSTGDWYVWDSARGIVSGNDPHLSLNSTAAEVTTDDTIDTDSTGFVVNQVSATNVNVSSATYIGLAIA